MKHQYPRCCGDHVLWYNFVIVRLGRRHHRWYCGNDVFLLSGGICTISWKTAGIGLASSTAFALTSLWVLPASLVLKRHFLAPRLMGVAGGDPVSNRDLSRVYVAA